MKNWLEIAVGLYLLGMVLYGHYRGVFRMAVSMVAVIVTFGIVQTAMPHVTSFIKNETPVYSWIYSSVERAIMPEENETDMAEEAELIRQLGLPKEMQEFLIENNTHSVYESMGVRVFTEYVSNYLAGLIISAVGFVVLFAVVYIAIHIIMRWLDLMAKLPIISGINKLAGALLGGLQGLFFLWLLSILITAFSREPWARAVIAQIESSRWLAFLYHYNLVSKIVLGLVRGI